jgi:transglutaminase-like putative cysteine protease
MLYRGGTFLPAPAVITRFYGARTEHSYAQVALLRRAGLAARYSWCCIGWLDKKELAMDHKFAEVWLPGYGWVPLEPLSGTMKKAGVLDNYPLVFGVRDGAYNEFMRRDTLANYAGDKAWERLQNAEPAVAWMVE